MATLAETSSTFIIAVPGTQETREWPRAEAQAAIARGEIAPDQWAWSPTHNEWKTVADIPELQVAPPPPPLVSAPPPPTATPVQDTAPPQKVNLVKSSGLESVKHDSGIGFFKIFLFLLSLAVAGIIGANYVYVDQPLRLNLTQTTFPTIPVHAHLGGFYQRDTLVIHVLSTTEVSEDKLGDFLVCLAKSTPPQPLDTKGYSFVGLTSAWASQYVISGDDWKTLATMDKASADEKETFILAHLAYANGEALLRPTKITDAATLARRRGEAWASLSGVLVHS